MTTIESDLSTTESDIESNNSSQTSSIDSIILSARD